MQVLVVEDEKRLANALREMLENKKYKVDAVYDGVDGYEYARSGIYDIIILDVMLPRMDGFSVLSKIRQEKITTPVLMLTAKDQIPDKVKGLNLGADDYMTKPFAKEELLARIGVLTRRKGEVVIDKIECGNTCYYIENKELANVDNNKRVHLNFKEAELIELFMRHVDGIISKEDILTKVWGYDSDASDNNVEAYISFLRKKLSFLESNCEIVSIKKVGYTFGEKR